MNNRHYHVDGPMGPVIEEDLSDVMSMVGEMLIELAGDQKNILQMHSEAEWLDAGPDAIDGDGQPIPRSPERAFEDTYIRYERLKALGAYCLYLHRQAEFAKDRHRAGYYRNEGAKGPRWQKNALAFLEQVNVESTANLRVTACTKACDG